MDVINYDFYIYLFFLRILCVLACLRVIGEQPPPANPQIVVVRFTAKWLFLAKHRVNKLEHLTVTPKQFCRIGQRTDR